MGGIIVAMDELRFDDEVAVVTGAGRRYRRGRGAVAGGPRAAVRGQRLGAGLLRRPARRRRAGGIVADIRAAGGEAVLDVYDVGTVEGAVAVVERAVDERAASTSS